jgi:PAS domain S-box-containing protein
MDTQKEKSKNDGEVFQGAREIIYAHDLGGNFTFLNHVGEMISGYSCEEACRMNIAELVPAEIAEHVREEIVSNMTRRVGTVYEIDLISKDGRRVPLEVSTTVVLREGQPIEIQGIAVPSVIRGDSQESRCLDERSSFGITPCRLTY